MRVKEGAINNYTRATGVKRTVSGIWGLLITSLYALPVSFLPLNLLLHHKLPFEIQILGKSLADPQDLTESVSCLIAPTFAVTSPFHPHVTTTYYVSYIWAFQYDVLSAGNGQPLLHTPLLANSFPCRVWLVFRPLGSLSLPPWCRVGATPTCAIPHCLSLPSVCARQHCFSFTCVCIRLSHHISNETMVSMKCIAVHPGAVQGRINVVFFFF